ncbi:HPr kinase/phosphorylase [Thetidibacter halocola]|uniref:HPr kinase/phosphatase C-terminal domain-containing protein n=1 Tax=Thetidibacter halocola TaxID=2827239 RepID=A0A8J8B8I5_9RHOB|nr:HPr kinase/phosphatase C-terminal domain-containing protein [Thetidibacter halocola]MBS0124789.1 HPr kinase/phosphatase C-terminal domain-containing protein [Thetidibacter halocola]
MSSAVPSLLHATSVAVEGRGLLIRGASGTGKSALAMELIALGARLVADDRTELHRRGDTVMLRCPQAISGLIEARGIGILRVGPVSDVPLCAIVDLDAVETERLPPERHAECLGLSFPLLHKVDAPYFTAGILTYMRQEMWEGP